MGVCVCVCWGFLGAGIFRELEAQINDGMKDSFLLLLLSYLLRMRFPVNT